MGREEVCAKQKIRKFTQLALDRVTLCLSWVSLWSSNPFIVFSDLTSHSIETGLADWLRSNI